MDIKEIEQKLKAPFPADAIEWRVQRAMSTKKGNKAIVLAYITSRAVMDRLDDVFGMDGWQDQYEFHGDDVVCNLAVRVGDTWITKSDGAPQTNVESFKGGISDALKRVAVKYGIGRYLYQLSESWVDITEERQPGDKFINDKKAEVKGYWTPPTLPAWALPAGEKSKAAKAPAKKKQTPKQPIIFSLEHWPSNADYEIQGEGLECSGKTLRFMYEKSPSFFLGGKLAEIKDSLTHEDKESIKQFIFEMKRDNKEAA